MKFDDCIYKEITWFNADEIVEHETFDGIDSYELLRNLATLETGYSLDDRLDDEAVERVEDEENSLICVGRFRFDSLLAEGLAEWFKCDRYDGLVKHVRSCWLSRGGDDWYFYFVTGCGYDVISSDLLGCDVDEARRLAENDFRYVADADTRLAFELCVLVFDAMFPQHVEVRQTDVDGTLEHIAFPASWQHDLAVSSTPENRMSAYRNGLSAVRKAYDKMFDRLGEAD